MDAINSLVAGMHRSQVTFDGAAQQLDAADLPTSSNPDPTNPIAPQHPAQNVDVADQLVTMMVAADMHHVTAAALRSAFSMYQESLDLVGRTPRG
jgi:flagellar basal body rod protein FlgC